jgi:hypothetical protein
MEQRKLSIIHADDMENLMSSYKSSNQIEESGELGNNMRKLVISHGTVEEDIDGESEKTPVPSHSKFMQAQADQMEQSMPIRAYQKNLGL